MKNKKTISRIIEKIAKGELDALSAIEELEKIAPENSLGYARIDHGRKKRCGFPEFVYGEGKTLAQISGIISEIRRKNSPVLVTRLPAKFADGLKKKFADAEYDHLAKLLHIGLENVKKRGMVIIITAGTTDLPVALEAKYTAEICGCGTKLLADAGVAGIHRLLGKLSILKKADVVIAVAGMEGALPSVAGGLVSCPVIGVPTSIGYGSSFKGLTAMFAMLNSCASGVSVMNINNGFGAGSAAARIINRIYRT